MSTTQALILFALIVAAAVVLAVLGILWNVRRAAKLFRDKPEDDEKDPPPEPPKAEQ